MSRRNKKGFSNLNKPPKMWDYATKDQVSGITILASDAVIDFWGRLVHKDTEYKPNPFEYMQPDTYEPFPTEGTAVPEPISVPARWLYDRRTGAIWYSDDYSPGQYAYATQAQINSVVPIVNNQSFNYPLNSTTVVGTLVGTIAYTDTAGEGVYWQIDTNPNNAFSINSATGQLYIWDPQALTQGLSYSVVVRCTSYYPGNPYDTATITCNMVVGTYIVNPSPLVVEENQTLVANLLCTASTVTWAITGGVDAALFTIGSTSGVLSFLVAPDYETDPHSYAVQVTVTNTVTSDIDTVNYAVEVTNVIEGPVISSTANVSIAENNTAVQTMTGYTDTGGVLAWSITGGADSSKFSLGVSSGDLAFLTAPDYENPTDANLDNVYEVTVQLADGTAYPPDSQSKLITVTNVQDTPDEFGSTHTWLDFNDATTITLVSGNVQQINNKITAVGGNFAASSSGLRPTTTTSYFGGRTAIAASAVRLESSLAPSAWKFLGDGTGSTVFLTIHTRTAATASTRPFFGNNSAGTNADIFANLNLATSNNIGMIIAGGSNITSTPSPTWAYDTSYVVAYRMKSGSPNIEIFLNGVSKGTGAKGSDSGTPTTVLALLQQNASSLAGNAIADYWLTEFVVYNATLDDTALANATTFFRNRAGI